MIVKFKTPVKIVSFRERDKITIETSECTINQITNSLSDKVIIVRTNNLPDVIAVESHEYDLKEYSVKEIIEKFKTVVTVLSDRNRIEEGKGVEGAAETVASPAAPKQKAKKQS